MKLEELTESKQAKAEQDQVEQLAYDELGKIENSAIKYFGKKNQARARIIQDVLDKLDNHEFEQVSKHREVMSSIKDNYDYADDTGVTSNISLDAIITALKDMDLV